MNKRDKINYLLHLVAEEVETILKEEEESGLSMLTPNEVIGLAIDLVTRDQFSTTNIKYSSPLASVQRDFVQFSIGDDLTLPLQPEEEYDED